MTTGTADGLTVLNGTGGAGNITFYLWPAGLIGYLSNFDITLAGDQALNMRPNMRQYVVQQVLYWGQAVTAAAVGGLFGATGGNCAYALTGPSVFSGITTNDMFLPQTVYSTAADTVLTAPEIYYRCTENASGSGVGLNVAVYGLVLAG
jgi:hypothetical protein